jgi:outer membrane biosynthesis protein TonB
LKSLGEFVKFLDNRGCDFDQVITKISFDMDAESPKLTFKALGILDDKTAAAVKEMAETDLVKDIVGGSLAVVHESMAEADQKLTAPKVEEEEEEAPAPKAEAKPKKVVAEEVEEAPKPKAKPKAKPVVVEEEDEFDLDGISFDD